MYMKVLGLFRALPLEEMSLRLVCRLTRKPKGIVKPILDQLVEEEHIQVNTRKYKLTGKWLKHYEDNIR